MMLRPFLLLVLVLLTKSSTASNNGLSDELRFIHQEIGSLRAENDKQNMEIASLKETVQIQNTTINQLETTIKELITDDRPESSAAMSRRNKRPARLLPPSILRGKQKNKTIDQENRKLFYGPPTNCSDLVRLGYTLNGFYQVKHPVVNDQSPLATKLDTVYCAFKQEGAYIECSEANHTTSLIFFNAKRRHFLLCFNIKEPKIPYSLWNIKV